MASKDPPYKSGDILDCAICLERLKVPKYLPCLHTFCESCLQTYINASIDNTKSIKCFPCPMCRQSVAGESVINTETWASQFPFNNTIFSLMEKSSEIEESSLKKCDPCRRGGDVSKAVKWCTNCQDFLCDTCENIHSKIKATISHKVVSFFDRTSIEQEAIETEIPCKAHRGKYIEVFCVDHDRMCCVICLAVNHRQCKNIKTIDDMVATFDDVPIQVGDTIKDVCTTFEGFITEKEAAINELKTKKEKLDEQIDLEIANAIEKLKLVQSNSHEALNKVCHSEFDSLQTELYDLTRRKISLGQLMQFDQLLRIHGTKKQRFFNSQNLNTEITDMVNNLPEITKSVERREICFTVNDDFKLLLSNSVKLCDITVQRKTTDIKCLNEVASKLALILTNIPKEMIDQLSDNYVRKEFENVKLKRVISINAKSLDDTETPWLTGGSFLSDETCIFADNKNTKLKLVILSSGQILKEMKLEYKPVDIKTRLRTSQLFVSNDQKSIMIYLLDTQYNATLYRSIAFNDDIWGFDLLDNSLYVHNTEKAQIEVIHLDGSFMKTINTSTAIYNGYICCDTYSKSVISSRSDHVLKINDNNEERFSNEILKEARGVACDRNGNIYVCGRSSKNIVLLNKDFKRFRDIQLSDTTITTPYAIGFDTIGRRLFLTSNAEITSVEIYELV